MKARKSISQEVNYTDLDAVTQSFLKERSGEIQALMRRTAEDIIAIGQKLIEVKEKLGHGRFGAWLNAEFGWSWDTAGRFINVATHFSDIPQIAEFAPSALYILAASSTSELARREVLDRAQAGERISYKVAQEIKRKYTPSKAKLEQKAPSVKAEVLPASESSVEFPYEATELSQGPLEILAICSKKSTQGNINSAQDNIDKVFVKTPLPLTRSKQKPSIRAGDWWQLGEKHLLYCGNPKSTRFQERLPAQIALSLAFPPTRENWSDCLSDKIQSALSLFTPYQDQDLRLLEELIERSLLLYTDAGQTVVFSFLPAPELLLLAHQLHCYCFIAEPDAEKCERAIAAFQREELRVERVKGVRF
jgi:hypothetical protein